MGIVNCFLLLAVCVAASLSQTCDLSQLEGRNYHITSTKTNKWWHTDVSKNSEITTKWSQGAQSDAYTEFSFVKLSSNRFKIRRNGSADFVFHRENLFYTGLNNLQNADIFIILPVCSNRYILVREATSQFVYLDINENPNIGTNALYSNSMFRFEEI